jgi:hypothetical protein
MTEPRKRTNAELWAAIEKASDDTELARIDTLDEEALDRELRAAGIDPDEAAAFVKAAIADVNSPREAKALAARQAPARPPAPSTPRAPSALPAPAPRPLRSRWEPYVATAAVVALVASALTKENHGTATPPPPHEQAAPLREEATEACMQRQWKRCAEKLDEARLIDPAGESDPLVAELRAAIRDASHPR